MGTLCPDGVSETQVGWVCVGLVQFGIKTAWVGEVGLQIPKLWCPCEGSYGKCQLLGGRCPHFLLAALGTPSGSHKHLFGRSGP